MHTYPANGGHIHRYTQRLQVNSDDVESVVRAFTQIAPTSPGAKSGWAGEHMSLDIAQEM